MKAAMGAELRWIEPVFVFVVVQNVVLSPMARSFRASRLRRVNGACEVGNGEDEDRKGKVWSCERQV